MNKSVRFFSALLRREVEFLTALRSLDKPNRAYRDHE
jgi:hypothetical protein